MKFFLHWLIAAIAIGVAAYLVPGASVTPVAAIVLAVVLALINVFVRPIVAILTLPITILTLGIFSLIVNALLVYIASFIVPGFVLANFGSAFLFALLLALINTVFGVRFMRP